MTIPDIRAKMARYNIKQRRVAANLSINEVQLSRLLNGVRKDPAMVKRVAGVVDLIAATRLMAEDTLADLAYLEKRARRKSHVRLK
jgi:transcriptional regulator with XRE-family HTH domain